MKNRLNLNFALQTQEERTQFISQYLKQIKFTPTESELDTIAKYILWGKDINGKNSQQNGEVDLETAHGTWDTKEIESLDGLYESENFTEALVRPLNSVRPLIRKPTFSRDSVPHTPEFLELWAQIDETEFLTQSYELTHGRRTKPIRSELLSAISQADQEKLYQRALTLSEKNYLKLRHYLVELRTEQYTLRDSFVTIVQRNTPPTFNLPQTTNFGTEILVLPLGIDSPFFFRPLSQLNPQSYTPLELEQISNTYWSYREKEKKLPQLYFDFRKFEHVYQLFLQFFELEDDCAAADNFDNSQDLLKVLRYYVDFADLNEVYADILRQKMAHNSNIDIAIAINKKYGKTYSANYISTIFCKKIIPSINEAAANHQKIISNLFFEENFKQCTCCKTWLLRDSTNFIKKTRSPDGFNTRCKKCDKEIRNKKKNDKAGK